MPENSKNAWRYFKGGLQEAYTWMAESDEVEAWQ